MKRIVIFLVLSGYWCTPVRADVYPRNPDIDITHYVFTINLNDTARTITGAAMVTVRFLADGVSSFSLDLIGKKPGAEETGMTVSSITGGGQPVQFEHENNRILIHMRSGSQKNERRRYTVTYSGVPADGLIIGENKFGERTFFGDNWPDRCRYWLPTVDHPYDKATCEFVVTAPGQYQVIANGMKYEETVLPDNRRLTHWKESAPIPTYCMVLGAARFAVQNVGVYNGVPLQTWVYAQNRDAGFYDFARVRRVIEFFSSRFGAFPYEKLANVQSKTRYGGMENSSNIFYSERSVSGRRRSENTMTHEIVHQWFGDAVTEADWHHIWLSEGFATYFTHVFNEFTYGRDRMVSGLKRDRERIIAYCKRNPESPVVDTTITRLTNLLSTNSYQKGGWVLHMLRRLIGGESFWKGIRAYYRTYRNGTALTEDFQHIMEDASGSNLDRFFRQWLFQPGIPQIHGAWRYAPETQELTVTLEQIQSVSTVFTFPLDVGIYFKDETAARKEMFTVDERIKTFTITLDKSPESVVLDPDTWILMESAFSQKK